MSGNTVSIVGDNGTDLVGTYSFNGGVTWSTVTNLTNNTGGNTTTNAQSVIIPPIIYIADVETTVSDGMTTSNVAVRGVNSTNFQTTFGPFTVVPNAFAPAIAASTAGSSQTLYVAAGAFTNDIYASRSVNLGPFSSPVNVFGPTAQLNAPAIATSGIGVTIAGQGLNGLGQQSIFGSYSLDGMTWGPQFPIYSAQTNDSLLFAAGNMHYVNAPHQVVLFALESNATNGSLVNIWGDPASSMHNFMSAQIGPSQVGQSFSSAPAGCVTNPPALSAAIGGLNASNGSAYLVQSINLTNPSLFTSSLLNNNNNSKVAAGCGPTYSVFTTTVTTASTATTNAYTCLPTTK